MKSKRFTYAGMSRVSPRSGSAWPGRLCVLLLVFLGLAVSCSAARRPNVILILTDDQSPRNPPTPEYPKLVSPPGFGFGGDRVLTRNIDLQPEVHADLKARLKKHLATFPNRPFGEFTR